MDNPCVIEVANTDPGNSPRIVTSYLLNLFNFKNLPQATNLRL